MIDYDAIKGAKKIIDTQLQNNNLNPPFSEYSKVYLWTNENIKEYLNMTNLDNHSKALTVASSGDHALELALKGVKDITAFDTNKLTEYLFSLKKALILKYDYNEFFKIIDLLTKDNTPLDVVTNIIWELLPFMEKKHQYFWQSLLDYNYNNQKHKEAKISLINLLCLNTPVLEKSKNYNSYLLSEEAYNVLKANLLNLNYCFREQNAHELGDLNDHYDAILLSNILDYFYKNWGFYWPISNLQEFSKSLEKICFKDAIIFLHYIFNYGTETFHSETIFNASQLKRKTYYLIIQLL